jgi:hypothetical protein
MNRSSHFPSISGNASFEHWLLVNHRLMRKKIRLRSSAQWQTAVIGLFIEPCFLHLLEQM